MNHYTMEYSHYIEENKFLSFFSNLSFIDFKAQIPLFDKNKTFITSALSKIELIKYKL